MADSSRLVFGIMVFVFFLSVIMASITETTYNLFSPITLAAISIPLIAVIAASNTPIVKGGAMATFFITLAAFFTFTNLPLEIYGIIIVPIFIALGLAFAEIGQG